MHYDDAKCTQFLLSGNYFILNIKHIVLHMIYGHNILMNIVWKHSFFYALFYVNDLNIIIECTLHEKNSMQTSL